MTAAKAFLSQIVEAQDGIIQLQSEIIDGLFPLLERYISAEELCKLPETGKLKDVEKLMKEYKGD